MDYFFRTKEQNHWEREKGREDPVHTKSAFAFSSIAVKSRQKDLSSALT